MKAFIRNLKRFYSTRQQISNDIYMKKFLGKSYDWNYRWTWRW